MDFGACNVVYFDKRATSEYKASGTVSTPKTSVSIPENASSPQIPWPGSLQFEEKQQQQEVERNIQVLLATFSEVYICRTASSCISRVARLADRKLERATIVFIDVSHSHDRRSSSVGTGLPSDIPSDKKMTGTDFLSLLRQEAEQYGSGDLILPVVLLSYRQRRKVSVASTLSPTDRGMSPAAPPPSWKDPAMTARYLDAGAIDVVTTPLSCERIEGLPAQAYRIYKDHARQSSLFPSPSHRRRRSTWVGGTETKPYHYMREAMVSSLIDGICNPEHMDEEVEHYEIPISPQRQRRIEEVIGRWEFSAHEFTDDELLYGLRLILEHVLKAPELEKFYLPPEQLTKFLFATRQVYNSFVLYHNFRHACDVVQASFVFLLKMGALAPYYNDDSRDSAPYAGSEDQVERLMDPFHSLTLIISAIGHDVGHPGVNNTFLISTNTPLAQLYSDRSVLESFHCAAYAQILRRYWPVAFSDKPMRKLMISSIIATDMADHKIYMDRMSEFLGQVDEKGRNVDEWASPDFARLRALLCSILIKCADISNVPRPINTAIQWAQILTDEFTSQHEIEEEMKIPTCLFGGVPKRNDMLGLGNSQIGFIRAFGLDLFGQAAKLFPSLQFIVSEIERNHQYWQDTVTEEHKKAETARQATAPPIDQSEDVRRPSNPTLSESPSRLSHTSSTNDTPLANSRHSSVTEGSAHEYKKTPFTSSTISGTTLLRDPGFSSSSQNRRDSARSSIVLGEEPAGISSKRSSETLAPETKSSEASKGLPSTLQTAGIGPAVGSPGKIRGRSRQRDENDVADPLDSSISDAENPQSEVNSPTEPSERNGVHDRQSTQSSTSVYDHALDMHRKTRSSGENQSNAPGAVSPRGSRFRASFSTKMTETPSGPPDSGKGLDDRAHESSKTSLTSTLRKLKSSMNLSKDKIGPSESSEEIASSAEASSHSRGNSTRKEGWKFWKRRAESVSRKDRRSRSAY